MFPIGTLALPVLGLFGMIGHELSGLVEDAAGKPVPGVAIWLSCGWNRSGVTPSVARAKADENGHFLVPVPQGVPVSGSGLEMLSVWAYQAGHAPARIHVSLSAEKPREEVRLTLPTARPCRLVLLRPDGKPLAGAEVRPFSMVPSNARVVAYYLSVPDALAEQLAARTDEQGKAEISYVQPGEAPILTVSTADLGVQEIQWQPPSDKAITLLPVGRVVGRVRADDPAVVRGIPIYLGTQFNGKSVSGLASTRTDDQGRFVVPALAEGLMLFQVGVAPRSPYRPVQPAFTPIAANRENHLEITLKRGVRVRGQVRERGSNRPIAEAGVLVGSQYRTNVVYSDDAGRFEDYVLPGTVGTSLFDWLTPRPFFPTRPPGREEQIPANVSEFEIPPIELARGDALQGKVVDASGTPVAGARVDGTLVWQQGIEGENFTTSTAPDGTFVFAVLDPRRAGFRLEASTADARTDKPFEVSPALDTPVTLTIRSANLVSLAARVVNRTGQPVAGAELEFWAQEQEYSNPVLLNAAAAGSPHTGSDGRFETPRQFRIDQRYKVRAAAPGLSLDWSDWMRPRPGTQVVFPDLVVDRPKPITGRVADGDGRPVAGARIRLVSEQPERPITRSAENGLFQVNLPPAGTMMICAEAEGYRFQGSLLQPAADSVELVLSRAAGPAAPGPHDSPAGFPAEERRRLALRVLEPDIERARTGPCGVTEFQTLQTLARIDPALAMEIAEKAKFAEPMMRDGVKVGAARRLMKETPDEALTLVESLGDPIGRTDGYRKASDLLPATERDKKRSLLMQALVHTQGIKDPALRLIFQGQIASRLLDLGDQERATKIFRDGQRIAGELATSAVGGFGRGAFADELVRVDVPAALGLIEGLTDEQEFDRHHGNIAQRLASTQPAEAERVWQMLKRPIMRDFYALRVCYAMAPKDLPRARAIAARIGDLYTRAYTLGQMALVFELLR